MAGSSLRSKILEPLVYKKVKKHALKKPLLIVIITDGEPTGEPRDTVVKAIVEAKNILAKTPYTPDAVSFQLAQVGNDQDARAFLEFIDTHPQVGSLVDVRPPRSSLLLCSLLLYSPPLSRASR